MLSICDEFFDGECMEEISRKQAKELGLKFYFTGKPCKHGHIAQRRTSNGFCLGCESDEEYKKYKSEVAKKHYFENTEHRKSCIRRWSLNNKDKVTAYREKWRNSNLDYFKDYYEDNKEFVLSKNRDYKKSNKDVVAANNSYRRAAKINATPAWLSKEQLEEIRQIYKLSSEISEYSGIKHNVDHIVPLVSDVVCGLHVPWNLQVITAKENLSKGNRFYDTEEDMTDGGT